MGPTGSGKSTFVKLVQRLYDLSGGRILIDGQDIARVTQTSLRRAIAVVPQDPALFHRTIAENIAYARPDATPDEITSGRQPRPGRTTSSPPCPTATRPWSASAGVKLSGGERQRVAIARAFLADAPILVLDEATSSLDVETEVQVQAATEELMAGRTTIVIAHRLSTIRHADRILVFQDGRVIEEGRHADLVALGRRLRPAERGGPGRLRVSASRCPPILLPLSPQPGWECSVGSHADCGPVVSEPERQASACTNRRRN